MDCFVAFLVGLVTAGVVVYIITNLSHKEAEVKLAKEYEEHLESYCSRFNEIACDRVRVIEKKFAVEKQELINRNIAILDEISKVTGIDTVELPTFGTIYLNHSKNLQEAMQAIHMENEDDEED